MINPFKTPYLYLIAWLILPAALKAAEEPPARPNILFIVVDDLRPELGCYGVDAAKTPHIDEFAKEALLFERAYCQQAVCRASRLSFLAGLRPDSRNIRSSRDVRSSLQDIDFFPEYFRKHGYETIGFGKIAHNGEEEPDCWSTPHRMPKNGFYEYRTEAGRKLVQELKDKAAAAGEPDPFLNIPEKIHRGMPWEVLPLLDAETGDGQIAEMALKAMEEVDGKPFFLAAGFLRPHLPFVAPTKYWDLHDPEELPTYEVASPPEGSSRLIDNRSGELLRQYRGLPKTLPLDKEIEKKLVHGYYACVSFIDAQIGRLLERLEERGLAENTIVIITSDHGFQLGDHGMWGKATNFELSTRVPLIIRAPGMKAPGKRTESLAELVGLYPTLCDLVDLPKPEHLQGTSFAPLLDDPELTLRETAFSQYPRTGTMGRSIRTRDFRFTEWRDNEDNQLHYRELYDHRAHSREDVNIAEDEAHAELVKRLSKRLTEGSVPAN